MVAYGRMDSGVLTMKLDESFEREEAMFQLPRRRKMIYSNGLIDC